MVEAVGDYFDGRDFRDAGNHRGGAAPDYDALPSTHLELSNE
jgi:hypothetical protein